MNLQKFEKKEWKSLQWQIILKHSNYLPTFDQRAIMLIKKSLTSFPPLFFFRRIIGIYYETRMNGFSSEAIVTEIWTSDVRNTSLNLQSWQRLDT